jgi:hypothetical protein
MREKEIEMIFIPLVSEQRSLLLVSTVHSPNFFFHQNSESARGSF